MEMVSSSWWGLQWWPSSQEALCGFSVCLRLHQIAPECNAQNFLGSIPTNPPRVKDHRAAMFPTSAENFALPPMYSYVQLCTVLNSWILMQYHALWMSLWSGHRPTHQPPDVVAYFLLGYHHVMLPGPVCYCAQTQDSSQVLHNSLVYRARDTV